MVCAAVIYLLFCALWVFSESGNREQKDFGGVFFDPGQSHEAEVRGTLCQRIDAGSDRMLLSCCRLSAEGKEIPLPGTRILVYTREAETDLPSGSDVTVFGELGLPSGKTLPGGFDQSSYCKARNIELVLRNGKIRDYNAADGLFQLSDRVFSGMKTFLERVFPPDDAGTVSALLLGEKEDLPEYRNRLYREAGISHILAISGLHIGLAGAAFWRFLRKRRRSFFTCAFMAGFLVCVYVRETGTSFSALRAAVVFLLWAAAKAFGRKPDALTSLSAAALVILLPNPYRLADASFLLSFSCILSLLLIYPVLTSMLPKVPSFLKKLLEACCATVSILAGTAPVLSQFFYSISLCGIAANLLILPLVPVLFLLSLSSVFISFISVTAGKVPACAVSFILAGMDRFCTFLASVPGSVLVTGHHGIFRCVLWFFFLAAALLTDHIGKNLHLLIQKKHANQNMEQSGCSAGWRSCICILFFALSFAMIAFPEYPNGRAAFLDTGQGDCILVQYRSKAFLIDCGSSTYENIWDSGMEDTLLYFGIRTLDTVFLTHGDQDHINGITGYLDALENGFGSRVKVLNILTARESYSADESMRELAARAQKVGIRHLLLEKGDQVICGPLSFTCLFPGEEVDHKEGITLNESSLVLMLRFYDLRILLTGDLESEGERMLLQDRKADLAADILKCGHHGSANATGTEFLERVRPKIAVISCGRNNRYGHPSGEVLKRLEEQGCRVFRTDLGGSILLEAKHGRFRIRSMLG